MLLEDIALSMIPNVGPKTAMHLLKCFGSADAVFNASMEELTQKAELRETIAKCIYRKETFKEAEKEITFIEKHKIRAIPSYSPAYPKLLKECADYPYIIYVKGDTDLNSPHWLSVVGTRKMTSYGAKACNDIISELAQIFPDTIIVSGLAYGVDISAHRAAMNTGLKTVGIVAHPLNKIYPPRHTESARRMVMEGGAIISEYPTNTNPDRSAFVQRNRIIAGISHGTFIVESAEKGGSLITADIAHGYDRTVMAVPGRMTDIYSQGTNNLIKSLKAEMVCCAEDIANALGWEIPENYQKQDRHTPENANKQYNITKNWENSAIQNKKDTFSKKQTEQLLTLMKTGSTISIDELCNLSGIPINEIAVLLLDLEFSGAIRSLPGKMYIKY